MAKILHVLQDKEFFCDPATVIGGYIAHTIGVVEALQRLGQDVVIAAFGPISYWDNSDVRYWQFKTREIPIPKFGGMMRQWQLTNQIIEAGLAEKPELIYVRWTINPFFIRVRRAFPHLPIVMECNTPSEMYLGINRANPLRKWFARRSDKGYVQSATLISAVSAETREFLLSHHPALDPCRVIVNPNGVDASRFCYVISDVKRLYKIPLGSIVIGWAGNIQYWHRVDLLIKAFHELDLDNSYLMIIGTGHVASEENLRSLAAKYRPSQTIFTGPVPFDQMPEYLSACEILVAPLGPKVGKKLYGSPIKLYEYMAVGRAVVGSRIGEISRVIEHGRNGLLFEPDSKEDLERVLRQLIENPSLREQLGQTARCDVEQKHSWEANVSRILDSLRDLQSSAC